MVNIDNLFKMISEKGITQSKLAENTSISTGNISDWKKGKSMPSAIKLDELATYFDCSVDYLLGRTDEHKTVNGHSIKTGDIGDNSSYSDTSIKISESQSKQLDETAQQLVNAFQQLDFTGKAKVMSLVAELINKVEKDKDL